MQRLTQSPIKKAALEVEACMAIMQICSEFTGDAGPDDFSRCYRQMLDFAKASADFLDAVADRLAYASNWEPTLSAQDSMLQAVEDIALPDDNSPVFERTVCHKDLWARYGDPRGE